MTQTKVITLRGWPWNCLK